MKCPKCKRPTELQTKRTFANGRTVKRERYCRKCKSRFVTLEQFQVDIEISCSEIAHSINVIESERDVLKERLQVHDDLFRSLGKAVKEAGK
jgi:transcriptional regulator NrdR family protein